MIDAAPGNEIPKLLNDALQLHKDQKYEESLIIFEKLLVMDSGNPKLLQVLLRCLMQLKRFEEARELYSSFDDNVLADDEILKIKRLLDNSSNENVNISFEKLAVEVKDNPKDKNLRFKLAENYLSSTMTEKGFNELLILYEQDQNWNDSAAKKKLLEYFDLLGFNDPNVIEARKKLSRIMFK